MIAMPLPMGSDTHIQRHGDHEMLSSLACLCRH